MRGIGGRNEGNQGENKKYEINVKRNVRIYKNIALTLIMSKEVLIKKK